MAESRVPYYEDLLGQSDLVTLLSQLVEHRRVPHALLFTGEDGGEALSLAFALARHILCMHPTPEGPCGHCSSCRQLDILENPDLNLVFPIIKEGSNESISNDFIQEFRAMVLSEVRFTEEEWRTRQDAKNKQLQILVSEAEQIIQYTSLRSFRSQHQVILMWLPEMMRQETANKLLKVLEEPPEGIVFILVSHQPELLLPTIISRLQRVIVPSIPEDILINHLLAQGVSNSQAQVAGHLAQGNLYKALKVLQQSGEEVNTIFGQALDFLALPMSRNPKLFRSEAERLSKLNRPDVIAILESVSAVLREVLALHYGEADVVYLPAKYHDKVAQISNSLSPTFYPQVMDDMVVARQELKQNANVKMVFFDLFLKLAMYYARSK